LFTAVAVAQLMAAGRFTPDTRASDLLPELPWSPAARAVTVRQLLEHTSGLGQAEHAGGDALAAVAAETPRFPPGTQWSYSNDGYELLAAIIAHVSGVSFERYLSRRVYRPAGMGGVSHDHARLPARVVAVGQRRRDDDYFGLMPRSSAAALVEGQRGTGAGGEYATTDDLIRFAEAFTSGRLLPAAWRDSLTAGRWPLPGPFPDERYGWGFASYMMRGHRIVGHAGGGMGWGICGRLDVEASSAFAVAVLSNYDPPVCERLGRGIAEMLAGL
jgi:CubicO group peptidase (beta-lactamase class C family)